MSVAKGLFEPADAMGETHKRLQGAGCDLILAEMSSLDENISGRIIELV